MSILLSTLAVLATATTPQLKGYTSNVTNGMHAVGRPVVTTFEASGLKPHERRTLKVTVSDAWERQVTACELPIQADDAGGWKGVAELPGDRYGFFRVRATAGADLTLPKCGSRPAGQLTYAVTVDPRDRRDLDEDEAFAGLHGEVYEGGFIAPWLGARWLMDGQRIQARQEAYDAELARRRATGWKAFGTICPALLQRANHPSDFLGPEGMAWRNQAGNFWLLFSDPTGRAYYATALERMARAARSQGYFQRSRYYEVMWEPDLSAPRPEDIVEACRVSREAIRKGDPEAKVCVATVCNTMKLDYLRRLCDAGLLEQGDVFSIHAYTAYPPEPSGFVRNIRTIRRMLAEHGHADMPMISTEHGFQAWARTDEELTQMNGMVRQQLILLGEGFRFAMPFVAKDFGGDRNDHPEGDYGLTYNLLLDQTRWGGDRVSPRPVAAALAAFSMVLDGFRPTAAIESLGPTVLGYAYQDRKGRVVLALWDFGERPSTVTVPVGRDRVQVADVMGNAEERSVPDGRLRLELGPSPTYVLDVSAEFWGARGTMPARLAEEAARRAEQEKAARKVEIVSVAPAWSEGRAALSVVVENRLDKPAEVVLEVARTATSPLQGRVTATLAPRGRQTVLLPVDNAPQDVFATVTPDVTVRLGDDYRTSRRTTLDFLSAEPLPGVGRGGDFSGWTSPRYHDVPPTCRRNPHLHGGAADLSARLAFGWNADYLLVDAVVDDDSFCQERTGWWTWHGDALQLGFAKTLLEAPTANAFADAMDQAATEVTFALTPEGPQACRTRSFDSVRFPCDPSGNGMIPTADCPFSVEKTERPGGGVRLRYRIAYPWRFLNRTSPKAGETCRFAASVNDLDAGADDISSLTAFGLQPDPPAAFGTIVLKGAK